jgi:hypothetical protein
MAVPKTKGDSLTTNKGKVMVRINLRVTEAPTPPEVFCSILRWDGELELVGMYVDTGAQTSVLPKKLMQDLKYELLDGGDVLIEQAGIAKQTFNATEALITLRFEDIEGNISVQKQMRVWFAETTKHLLGYTDALEHCELFVDTPSYAGWIEFK